MYEHLELRGHGMSLLEDLSSFPTGLTARRMKAWERVLFCLLTPVVLGAGMVSTVVVARALVNIPAESLWMSGHLPSLMVAALFVGLSALMTLGWWWVCRAKCDPWLSIRLQLAYQVLSRIVPWAKASGKRSLVRVSCEDGGAQHALRLEIELRRGEIFEVLVQERLMDCGSVCWTVNLSVSGQYVGQRELAELARMAPCVTFRSEGSRRASLRGFVAVFSPSHEVDALRSVADFVGEVCARASQGGEMGFPARPRALGKVQFHPSRGADAPVQGIFGAELSANEAAKLAFARPEGSGRFRRRLYRCFALSGAAVLAPCMLEYVEPGITKTLDLPLWAGFALLGMGMPACVGWWWEPKRRVVPAARIQPILGLWEGGLSLTWGTPWRKNVRIDLTRPFSATLGWSRDVMTVELRQEMKHKRAWSTLRFGVHGVADASVQNLARLDREVPVVSGDDFLRWVWPSIRSHAELHGVRLPGASLYFDEFCDRNVDG